MVCAGNKGIHHSNTSKPVSIMKLQQMWSLSIGFPMLSQRQNHSVRNRSPLGHAERCCGVVGVLDRFDSEDSTKTPTASSCAILYPQGLSLLPLVVKAGTWFTQPFRSLRPPLSPLSSPDSRIPLDSSGCWRQILLHASTSVSYKARTNADIIYGMLRYASGSSS